MRAIGLSKERVHVDSSSDKSAVISPPPLFCEDPNQNARTQGLCQKFELLETDTSIGHPWLLVVTADRLELRQSGSRTPGPIFVDFVTGKSAHRRKFGGGKGQPLAKAVGVKGSTTPQVLDLTGGMGRDAFVLATLGCDVQMIERSPVVAALLDDGLRRGMLDPQVHPIIEKMALIHTDAQDYLKTLEEHQLPDVIYMDPMYPHSKKSAGVKKEMTLLRKLVGPDSDSAEVLKQALQSKVKRIVVKRPAKAPALGEIKADANSASPNTRYDLYFPGHT